MSPPPTGIVPLPYPNSAATPKVGPGHPTFALSQGDAAGTAAGGISIKNMDQVLEQDLPDGARAWLGMLGFRVIVDRHGQVVRLDMPEQSESFDE